MKVIFLSRLFYPHIGGVERHVMEISKGLVKRGYEVVIITEQLKDTCLVEQIEGVDIYRIAVGGDDWFKKFRIWREMWGLRTIIKEADIIHCHDVFFWYLPFRFFYPKKPVYTTFHGYESFPIRKGAILSRKIAEKLSWGNICIGDFITKWYKTKATFVSYGATDLVKIKDLRLKLKDKNSAVFIGRLDEQTGVLPYAKTIEILKKKYPKFTFTIVGDGKYRKILEKNFSVLGFQKDPEKYFQQYRFAFVSRYLSILEALAARKLVFAVYDNSVKEDYLRMAPFAKFIIIEKDPKKLAEQIEYVIKHPKEEQKMIERGYAWVKKQSWEHLISVYIKLWKKK